jgi:hypothetical protein
MRERPGRLGSRLPFKGAKVDPNPYRFTLIREAGDWWIVQSPELHGEDRKDRIKIKL